MNGLLAPLNLAIREPRKDEDPCSYSLAIICALKQALEGSRFELHSIMSSDMAKGMIRESNSPYHYLVTVQPILKNR